MSCEARNCNRKSKINFSYSFCNSFKESFSLNLCEMHSEIVYTLAQTNKVEILEILERRDAIIKQCSSCAHVFHDEHGNRHCARIWNGMLVDIFARLDCIHVEEIDIAEILDRHDWMPSNRTFGKSLME